MTDSEDRHRVTVTVPFTVYVPHPPAGPSPASPPSHRPLALLVSRHATASLRLEKRDKVPARGRPRRPPGPGPDPPPSAPCGPGPSESAKPRAWPPGSPASSRRISSFREKKLKTGLASLGAQGPVPGPGPDSERSVTARPAGIGNRRVPGPRTRRLPRRSESAPGYQGLTPRWGRRRRRRRPAAHLGGRRKLSGPFAERSGRDGNSKSLRARRRRPPNRRRPAGPGLI